MQPKKPKWRKVKQHSTKDTPSPSTSTIRASFFTRTKAQIIDLFMLYTPIMYVITYGVLGSKEALWESQWAPSVATLLYGVIVAIFLAKTAQTPGKKAQDIKVQRMDKKPLTFLFSLYRFFVFLIAGASVVGILMPIWRKDKLALHDIICRTEVVPILKP